MKSLNTKTNGEGFLRLYISKITPELTSGKILSKVRQEYVNSATDEKVKKERTAVWVLLQNALVDCGVVDLDSLNFTRNENGKWCVGNLKFSLSHSKSVVAVAVSDKNVGIDVEMVKEIKSLKLKQSLSTVYSPITQWTREESYYKATGKKLKTDQENIKSYSISVEGEEYKLSVCSDQIENVKMVMGNEFMDKKVFVFDLDGTLIDSMPTFERIMLATLDKYNVKYTPDVVNVLTPLGTEGILDYFRQVGITASREEILEFIFKQMADEYFNRIPLKPTVYDTLITLKNSGYSLNVLTASPHLTLDPCLKRLGVYDLFDNVYSSDDFNTSKSNPEIYKMLAKKLNVKESEMTFIDDNLTALKTAKSVGVKVYGVFDKSSISDKEEIISIADGYLLKLADILKVIL